MSSKKQEERNEKVIRGLMKLPPNRRCINCNSLGPQYVCTNFWTFVCVACSGIHREFTHRVKSVSMSKFTTQEVEALQRGGNQCAREMFLKDWDTQRMRLPDSSNADKIRFFIKDVYVHKKYAGGRSSDKPSRDMQNLKNHEVQKRTSSYHSYSQSPPYENQYEDRRYGKQTGKRPGSDRVFCERKFSSFVYSPGQLGEQMYEDRSANGSSGSRTSDFSVSSSGDPFRSDGQSPHFQDNGYSSSSLHDNLGGDAQAHMLNRCSEMHIKRDLDGFRHPQRTASLSSFESFDSNSVSLKSVNSGSLFDIALVPEHSSGAEPEVASAFHSLSHSSASLQARSQDLFCLQPPMTYTSRSLDLLDVINNQPLSTTPTEQKTSAVPFSENHGWATFDVPHSVGPAAETNKGISAVVPPVDVAVKRNEDALTLMHYNSQCVPFQSSAVLGLFLSSTCQQNVGLQEDRTPVDQKSSQSWNAFDVSTGNIHHDLFEDPSRDIEPRVPMQKSHTSCDPYVGLKVPENPFEDVLQKSALEYAISGPSLPFDVVTGSSFPPSVLHVKGGSTAVLKLSNPFDIPYDSDLDTTDAFSDMSSLQAELPNPQLPTVHLGFLSQPWLNENSASPFTPSAPQGGVAHVGRQAPSSTPGSHLPSSPTQGLVALPGRNPFA